MRPRDIVRASTDAWLAYAGADIEGAQTLLGEGHLSHLVCFHAQQAVEKALKGYLVWLGEEDIPRTHDLVDLARRVAERGGDAPSLEAAELLSAYAVQVRYPEMPLPTQVDATEAVAFAEGVVSRIRSLVTTSEDSPNGDA